MYRRTHWEWRSPQKPHTQVFIDDIRCKSQLATHLASDSCSQVVQCNGCKIINRPAHACNVQRSHVGGNLLVLLRTSSREVLWTAAYVAHAFAPLSASVCETDYFVGGAVQEWCADEITCSLLVLNFWSWQHTKGSNKFMVIISVHHNIWKAVICSHNDTSNAGMNQYSGEGVNMQVARPPHTGGWMRWLTFFVHTQPVSKLGAGC